MLEELSRIGFDERRVAAWFGVPHVTEVVHVLSRRPARATPLDDAVRLHILGDEVRGARADVLLLPIRGLYIASDRVDAPLHDRVAPPDLSSLKMLDALPDDRPWGASLLDVGCGTGLLSIAARKKGFVVRASDVHARSVERARQNAMLNRVDDVRFEVRDLVDGITDRYDVVLFNAPLTRSSREAEDLVLRWLARVPALLHLDGEAILHAQLTQAIREALSTMNARFRVTSVSYADSGEAITKIRAG